MRGKLYERFFCYYFIRVIHKKIGLGDETVSVNHAEIVYRDNQCVIRECNSSNGTYVDGKKIKDMHILPDRGIITIGHGFLDFKKGV